MIAVLDYGIGNLRSAQKAVEQVGAEARLVTRPDEAKGASGVVLPGVGAFGPCIEALRESGLDQVALEAIAQKVPFLGICIGMQVLYEESAECPGVRGLGVLPGSVVELPEGQKRPQMQWNIAERVRPSAMLEGLGDRPWFYFVHSYAPRPSPETVAICDYGGPVVAAVESGKLWATQFHPEKSGQVGLELLGNFVRCCEGAAPWSSMQLST